MQFKTRFYFAQHFWVCPKQYAFWERVNVIIKQSHADISFETCNPILKKFCTDQLDKKKNPHASEFWY